MTDTMTILRPDVEEEREAPATMALRGPISGARLLLVDNGKPRARALLELLAGELCKRVDIATVRTVTKSAAGHPMADEQVADLARDTDLVIAGLGDCGSCSACSARDAIAFERAGVPATVVITDVFVGHVARFADNLGLPGYRTLVVAHPISSKDDEHLRRLAAAIAPAAEAQLAGSS
jgi:hypothetical protein